MLMSILSVCTYKVNGTNPIQPAVSASPSASATISRLLRFVEKLRNLCFLFYMKLREDCVKVA